PLLARGDRRAAAAGPPGPADRRRGASLRRDRILLAAAGRRRGGHSPGLRFARLLRAARPPGRPRGAGPPRPARRAGTGALLEGPRPDPRRHERERAALLPHRPLAAPGATRAAAPRAGAGRPPPRRPAPRRPATGARPPPRRRRDRAGRRPVGRRGG